MLAMIAGLTSCTSSVEPEVPMIALIANKDKYDARDITTSGFLSQRDDLRLYVNRDDARFTNKSHSIVIQLPAEADPKQFAACHQRFVSVSGTVHFNDNELVLSRPSNLKSNDTFAYTNHICNPSINRKQ